MPDTQNRGPVVGLLTSNGEWILMVLFFLWGIYIIGDSLKLSIEGLMFPVVVTVFFMVLLIIQGFRKAGIYHVPIFSRHDGERGEESQMNVSEAISLSDQDVDLGAIISVTLSIVLFVPLVWLFGYYIGSFLFIFGYLWRFSRFNTVYSGVVATLFTAFAYYIFHILFFIGLGDTGGRIFDLSSLIGGL